MKINELKTQARKSAKRKGRGISAGQGKTAGRGTKGQNSRSGGSRRPGFEGGQTPLFMRIPKSRGFKSYRKAATITLAKLSLLKAGEVSKTALVEAGLVDASAHSVKIVGGGEVKAKYNVDPSIRTTETAKSAIEKAGGTVQNIK